ncbi:MAG: Unknown protein [uncultured Campylobacterales bacterium]|uniref:Uncharacterized protein n=1 Tax=uncultured Campylobacterales bacterium TaxID=352960 RepID=A0A6S6TA48_9BACT|nr:MAG: Unknown protein [uncultured Campylobacterales bacterium]
MLKKNKFSNYRKMKKPTFKPKTEEEILLEMWGLNVELIAKEGEKAYKESVEKAKLSYKKPSYFTKKVRIINDWLTNNIQVTISQ